MDGLDREMVEESRISDILESRDMRQAYLSSIVPPITVPAWACSFSSLGAEDLDCFSFQRLDLKEREFVQSNRKKFAKYGYWNHTRKSSALFDVPAVVEPELDRGCSVSGLFDYGELNSVPEGLADEIRDEIGEPKLDFGDGEDESREEAKELFKYRWRVFEWLVENRDEDVYFPVFRLTDTMMHSTDSEDHMIEAYDLVAERLESFFEEHVDEDNEVLIVSDHGAVKAEKRFYLNTWLEEKGFLLREEEEQDSLLRKMVLQAADIGHRLGLRDLMVKVNRKAQDLGAENLGPRKSEVMDSLDWDSAEAFAHIADVSGYCGIWVNDDRLGGVVENVEVKKREISEKLEEEEQVAEVHDSTEIYSDPPENFPDLVLELYENSKVAVGFHPKVVSDVSGYMHRKQGVVASTMDLRDDELQLVDLAPTILHMLDEPVPDHIEGKSMLKGKQKSEAGDVAGLDF